MVSHSQVYPHALPQYNLGHGERLQALERMRGNLPGLFFVGNYLRGPAIGNCVELGMETAEEIARSRST
jgi:oxygen-dependent protoporphyrinogen oxidase